MTALSFDVHEIPFSLRGSWLDISPVVALHDSVDDLHLVSHQTGMHAVLSLVPVIAGEKAVVSIAASPSLLRWTAEDGSVEAAFETVDRVRLCGRGLDLVVSDAAARLTPFTGTYLFQDPTDGSAVFTSYETGRRYRITALSGSLTFSGAEALGEHVRAVTATGEQWEVVIEEFESARSSYSTELSFDEVVERTQNAFDAFLDSIAGWRDESTPAAELATYVLWSATVAPQGFLARESILMSKHWMDKVWSWDHCFNALALVPGQLEFALDQFLTPFDHQDAGGALPDSVTHSEILYNFVKPPIHGWALAKLRARSDEAVPLDTLARIYDHLSSWSRFWLDHRRAPGHDLPHYQHGNDSGWDNSTTFDFDRVIESPDLAGFLLVQLGVVADLADELGLADGAAWRSERDQLATALVDQLWRDDRFVARGALSGIESKTTSLLNLLTIVAAEHFAPEIAASVAAQIEQYLTEFGPATELTSSVDYDPDGYWRGPIWAPSTVLIEDGLRRSGHVELADAVSTSFRGLCEKSGFAENFDALTGAGLRDRAYTWTASSYLLLAHEAVLRERESLLAASQESGV